MRVAPQFLIFVAGGVLCAVVDIGVMQLLLRGTASALLATSAGFLAGLLLNYAFHARVTFGKVSSRATLLRFLCVVGLNYLITMMLVGAAVWLDVAPLWGKLLSLPLVAVNGFILSKHWIFR